VTQSGLRALERALADSQQALKTAQAIEGANERRRPLELAARDARYFAERVASAVLQPEPASATAVAFGSQVTILRDDGRRQTFRIVGEDEADPRGGSIAYVSPLAHRLIGSGSVRLWRWTAAKSRLSHDVLLVATAQTHGHSLLTKREAAFGAWTNIDVASPLNWPKPKARWARPRCSVIAVGNTGLAPRCIHSKIWRCVG
jgi:transcription elongation GreA/GreB family factor